MARLVVTHNYHHWLDPHAVAEAKPYPPLGTLTLASELQQRGHEVSFWDATFERDPRALGAAVARHRPDKVLLVADHHHVPQKMCLGAQREAALLQLRSCRGVPVVVSSPDASDHPQLYLAAGAAAVVRGESDLPLIRWADGEDLCRLPGVVQPGSELSDPAPPRALDALPEPRWDWVDVERYAAIWRAKHGLWEAPVSSARGCPYRCNWCSKPIWGRSLSLRNVDEVVRDAQRLGALGADRIWFTDDIFALKPSWLREFRAAIERRGPIPPYRCLSRVDLLARGTLIEDLAATGCVEIWVGAESGSQSVLDAMDKDCTVEQIYTARSRARALGIRMGFFLQLGYPGERLPELRRTIGMIRELMPEEIGISLSYPLPGTPFYEAVKHELLEENWETAMDCKLLYRSDYPERVYTTAREVIRHEHAALHGVAALGRLLRRQGGRQDLKRVAALAKHAILLPARHLELRLRVATA